VPELPEVEITTRKLQPLIGNTIQSFWNDRAVTVKNICGRKILRIFRRGKAVVFELSGNRVLAFHQRMSGKLIIKSADSFCSAQGGDLFNPPIVKANDSPLKSQKLSALLMRKHIHCKVFFADKTELWFHDSRKFGVVWYGIPKKVYSDKYFRNLGPDALDIREKTFILQMQNRRGVIKALLLNQHFLAGVGNIVADETLWRAKIHPQSRIENMQPAARRALYSALQAVLKRSIKAQGTTLRDWGHPDGQAGGFQRLLSVYGRAGQPCRRCGIKIERIVATGRGTHLCCKCQHLT